MKKNSHYIFDQQSTTLFDILCMPLLAITPFIYFLAFNDYGFLRIDSIIVLLGLFGIGLISFLLSHRIIGIKTGIGKDLLLASFITLSLSFLPGFQPSWIIAGIWALSLLASILLKQHFIQLLVIIVTAFIAGVILLPMPKQLSHATSQVNSSTVGLMNQKNSPLPPIIHLVLDEHIGIEGLPPEIAQSDELKQQLKTFYLRNGFELYGNAYSHYLHTYNALPNAVNFTTHDQDSYYFKIDDTDRILQENAYFDALQQKGYQIRVYQADYINFCKSSKKPVATCYTYPAASVTSIQSVSLPLHERILFLIKSFVITSSLYDKFLIFYQYGLRPTAETLNWELPKGRWYQARTCNIPILPVISKLIADIKQQPNGTVFFAHLLIPHNPYIYNANCEIDPQASHWRIDVGPLPLANDTNSRAARYTLYENQIRCSQKQVQRVFDTLKEAGVYDNAIIIVQGDHGSRIMMAAPSSENKSQLTSERIKDAYSTLFAVKMSHGNGIGNGNGSESKSGSGIGNRSENGTGNDSGNGNYNLDQKPIEQLLREVTVTATSTNGESTQTLIPPSSPGSLLLKPYVYLVPQQPGVVMEKYFIPAK
jgi:hypothetical protein